MPASQATPLNLPQALPPLQLAAVLAAAVAPTLMAYHLPPSATLLNQCLAVALWGVVAALMAPRRLVRDSWPVLSALALMAAAALASWQLGSYPQTLAMLSIGLLAGAALMVAVGADLARGRSATAGFTALLWALLSSGVLSSLVALVQVFAPDWSGDHLIAQSTLPGRAIGNLRQPNHLCTLLLWALVAAAALRELGRLPQAAFALLTLLMVFAVELSASRTGAVGLALLLLWALADRRLCKTTRWTLAAAPLLYAVAFAAMSWLGQLNHQTIGAGARMAAQAATEGAVDSPNSRLNVWHNTVGLIANQPWTGVGFGEFNLAWTMTPFANRATAFFDHSHNLPLQILVELGLPLGLLVLALLGLSLWRAVRHAGRLDGDAGRCARAALMLVLVVALHSLVEYPLWYAYFLLPTALAWGFVLGTPGASARGQTVTSAAPGAAAASLAADLPPEAPRGAWLGRLPGALLALAGVVAVVDYRVIAEIYMPAEGSGPLAHRIGRGQLSPLFAHHADYAAATNAVPPVNRALGLARGVHSLLDTRLMMAWTRQLAETGRTDEARWVAQRLRDFRNPDAAEFFAPCDDKAADASALPVQCQAPVAVHDWRSLARLPPLLAPPAQPQAGSSATQ